MSGARVFGDLAALRRGQAGLVGAQRGEDLADLADRALVGKWGF